VVVPGLVVGGALILLGLLCVLARDRLSDWNERGSKRLAGSNWDEERYQPGEYRPHFIVAGVVLMLSGTGLVIYGLVA
jgi:hypothetical protein